MQGKVCIRDDLLHSIRGSLSCFPWVQWAKKKYPGSEAVRGRWKRSVFKMRTVGTISIFLFLVVCAAIDLKKRSLPMWLLWAGSLGVLLISLWNTRLNLFPLFQGAVPGIVLGIISWITREAVGYGDVWIITLLGIYLGIWDTATLVCIAFFFSSIAAVGCLVWKKFRRDTRIPFVPFLTAAYVGVVFL